MSEIAINLRIHGRVQGVWYRAWTTEQARKRGLAGWVRNRYDGTVEALVQGPEDSVRDLIKACRKGPMAAKVTDIIETDPDPADLPVGTGFEKRDTV